MIKMTMCEWEQIQPHVKAYYQDNHINVDSYWEDHVLKSRPYHITADGVQIGFCAIHEASMITLFHLDESYAHLAQETFWACKKLEQVTCAMVPTGDELFLSLCMDDYSRIEKNAYFSIYTPRDIILNHKKALELIPVNREDQLSVLELVTDFWGEHDAQRALDTTNHFNIYLAQEGSDLVGFGVIEYSRIVDHVASIGMYVLEEKRQMGYAKNILKNLQLLVESKGCEARSGCWYYNHNSKKSIESAGGYAKSRLLRFYF